MSEVIPMATTKKAQEAVRAAENCVGTKQYSIAVDHYADAVRELQLLAGRLQVEVLKLRNKRARGVPVREVQP